MIVFFLLIMLVNSTLPNAMLLEYRFDVAGLPINILDGLIILALIMVPIGRSTSTIPTQKAHPCLMLSISLLVAAIIIGVVGAVGGDRDAKLFATVVRNAVTLPAAILIGYVVPKNIQLTKWAVLIGLLSSALSAVLVLVLARDATSTIEVHGNFDKLRSIHYGGDGGIMAASLLISALVGRMLFMNRWVTVSLILFCAVCSFTMPHRSGYVAAGLTFLFAAIVVPSTVKLSRRVAMTVFGVVLISISLWVGLTAMSAATGRNFTEYVIEKRLKQMIPGFEDETKVSITETRWTGILAELDQFAKNPLMGQGLGVRTKVEESAGGHMGMDHNVWTAMMAQCGVSGLFAYLIPVIGCIVVGLKLWRGGVDRWLMLMGAMGTACGIHALISSTLSMAINVQRPALLFGVIFGMVLRCRDIQMTLAQTYAGYLEPVEDDNPSLLPAL